MRHLWLGLSLAIVALTGGCRREVALAGGPLQLTLEPLQVRASTPMTASGPFRELCFTITPDSLPGANGTMLATPSGDPRVRVVLLGTGGERDTLGDDSRDRQPAITQEAPGEFCYWDTGAQGRREGRTYVGVELTAQPPLTIRALRWWSGRRFASL